mmetsp:Transcript_5102/g.16381  ORF Transcript_5102/g.16381 Transcript_5102/m.16381 type:complete len:203 (+) Transcript_5102:1527-2135(+)
MRPPHVDGLVVEQRELLVGGRGRGGGGGRARLHDEPLLGHRDDPQLYAHAGARREGATEEVLDACRMVRARHHCHLSEATLLCRHVVARHQRLVHRGERGDALVDQRRGGQPALEQRIGDQSPVRPRPLRPRPARNAEVQRLIETSAGQHAHAMPSCGRGRGEVYRGLQARQNVDIKTSEAIVRAAALNHEQVTRRADPTRW